MKLISALIATFLLGACAVNKTPEALDMAQRVAAFAQVHTDLAGEYYRVGQVSVAVKEAELSLAAAPDYVPAHNLLALMYAQMRQTAQADSHFLTALKLEPKNTDLRNNYAWYLCGSGRSDLALSEFSKVLRDPLYPSIDKALTNAGVCAARMGRADLASSYLNAALDINADNGVAHLYRAHVYLNAKNTKSAADDAEISADRLKETAALLWLQIRLARAQRQSVSERSVLLKTRYATSDEADWLKNEKYDSF